MYPLGPSVTHENPSSEDRLKEWKMDIGGDTKEAYLGADVLKRHSEIKSIKRMSDRYRSLDQVSRLERQFI